MRQTFILIALLVGALSLHAQTAKEWRDSVSVLSKMIDAKPLDMELRMRKAEANINLEQWTYAMDEYNNILDRNPHHIGALYFRGYVNSKLQRWAFARADYEEVLKLEPMHKGSLTGLAYAYLYDNQQVEAFDVANRMVDAHPDDPTVYITRADIEKERGMRDFAIEDINKAIEIETERFKQQNRPLNLGDDLSQYISAKLHILDKKKQKDEIQSTINLARELGLSKAAAETLLH